MANMTVQERLGVKPEWVVESYERTQNMMETAHALRISVATVHRILKKSGVQVDKHKVRGRSQIGKKRGCLYQWMQENPNVKLPEKPKDIAQVTGCSRDAVYSYLRRHKISGDGGLKKVPDLRRFSGTVQLEDGRYIVLSSIRSYKEVVDLYGNVSLEIGTLSGETVKAVLSLEGIAKKIGEGTWKERI